MGSPLRALDTVALATNIIVFMEGSTRPEGSNQVLGLRMDGRRFPTESGGSSCSRHFQFAA